MGPVDSNGVVSVVSPYPGVNESEKEGIIWGRLKPEGGDFGVPERQPMPGCVVSMLKKVMDSNSFSAEVAALPGVFKQVSVQQQPVTRCGVSILGLVTSNPIPRMNYVDDEDYFIRNDIFRSDFSKKIGVKGLNFTGV